MCVLTHAGPGRKRASQAERLNGAQYLPWNDCCGKLAARAVGGSAAGATTPALSTNNSASARGGVFRIGTASVIASVMGLSLLGPGVATTPIERSSTLSVGQRNLS